MQLFQFKLVLLISKIFIKSLILEYKQDARNFNGIISLIFQLGYSPFKLIVIRDQLVHFHKELSYNKYCKPSLNESNSLV